MERESWVAVTRRLQYVAERIYCMTSCTSVSPYDESGPRTMFAREHGNAWSPRKYITTITQSITSRLFPSLFPLSTMPAARRSPSSSPHDASTDVSPIPSSVTFPMNVSGETENEPDDEVATTPTAPTHPHPWAPRSVSAQIKRPRLAHRISVGSSLFATPGPSSASPYGGRGRQFAPSSLPSSGWAGPQRDFLQPRTPTVPPQNDYLADWETLQDLVVPASDRRSRSPSRRRDHSVGSLRSGYRSLGTPVRPGRTASARIPRVPSVTETDEDEEEPGPSSYSAPLSTSPPTFDGRPSLGAVGEQMEFLESPERPSILTMASPPRRIASPLPQSREEAPNGAPPTPATPSAAPKKPRRSLLSSLR